MQLTTTKPTKIDFERLHFQLQESAFRTGAFCGARRSIAASHVDSMNFLMIILVLFLFIEFCRCFRAQFSKDTKDFDFNAWRTNDGEFDKSYSKFGKNKLGDLKKMPEMVSFNDIGNTDGFKTQFSADGVFKDISSDDDLDKLLGTVTKPVSERKLRKKKPKAWSQVGEIERPPRHNETDLAAVFVDTHNEIRRNETEAQPPLGTLKWDELLAERCRVNVAQCVMKHDKSAWRKNNTEYFYVGQNLYMNTAEAETLEYYARHAVTQWFTEKRRWSTIRKKCLMHRAYCEHYTLLVWRSIQYVGCAIDSTCQGETFVCCNYGPGGNILGQTPY